MIAIVDYGMGNLRSVAKAIELVGGRAAVVSSPDEIEAADKLIVPGVGAFADAMENLRSRRLIDPIVQTIRQGKPTLGICLGLQLLFETGYEDGRHDGLALLDGEVVRFDFGSLAEGHSLAVPHMGWNTIGWDRECPLLRGIAQDSYFYFVHSYHVVPRDERVTLTRTEYGYPFTSSIWRDNLFATQFHPEKSQSAGLKLLENFVRL